MFFFTDTVLQASIGMQGKESQKYIISSVQGGMGGQSSSTTSSETTTTFLDAMCVFSFKKYGGAEDLLLRVPRLIIPNLTSRKICLDGANGY